MSCPLPNHDKQRIKYVCVDKMCRLGKKIGCADCFLECHATHKRMRLEEFQQQARTQVCSLSNMQSNVLKEDDIQFKDYEFDSIINRGLIDRQKTQAREIWKQNIKSRMYDQNKSGIDDSIRKINRMDQLLQETNFNQERYLELANIYFSPQFWTTLAKNKIDESIQIDKIVQKKDKYFSKMLNVADGLMRDLNFDEAHRSGELKWLLSPESVKTQRKSVQIKTRHFGTTAQKLFIVPATKQYKYNSP